MLRLRTAVAIGASLWISNCSGKVIDTGVSDASIGGQISVTGGSTSSGGRPNAQAGGVVNASLGGKLGSLGGEMPITGGSFGLGGAPGFGGRNESSSGGEPAAGAGGTQAIGGGGTGATGGSAGGIGGNTGGAGVAGSIGVCEACEQANCPMLLDECYQAPGVASAGPAAGQTNSKLCTDFIECAQRTKCAKGSLGAGEACYCGTFDVSTCVSNGGNGPCKMESEAAAETTVALSVGVRWANRSYAIGYGGRFLQCQLLRCAAECGLQ